MPDAVLFIWELMRFRYQERSAVATARIQNARLIQVSKHVKRISSVFTETLSQQICMAGGLFLQSLVKTFHYLLVTGCY